MNKDQLVLSRVTPTPGPVEIVERKGKGHPDTLCDALAENLATNLARYYREHFGAVFHHNVDKALLCGGRSKPRFSGGTILEPIDIYLAGRAAADIAGKKVPLEALAIEGSKSWLRANMRDLDVDNHVRLHCKVRPGSADLVDVFASESRGTPLANDTSIGVGYAPLSTTEQLVLDIDHRRPVRRAVGEDTKIMAARNGAHTQITFACAMVDAHLKNQSEYLAEKNNVAREIATIIADNGNTDFAVLVNTADDEDDERFFLTVTGTSAEAGDDGQVGRGNRINGLITPYRPMSLEAVAGKNSVNHVGKLYNITATEIAATIVNTIAPVQSAACVLVSQIGRPIDQPSLLDIRLSTEDGYPIEPLKAEIMDIVESELDRLPTIHDRFLHGDIRVY